MLEVNGASKSNLKRLSLFQPTPLTENVQGEDHDREDVVQENTLLRPRLALSLKEKALALNPEEIQGEGVIDPDKAQQPQHRLLDPCEEKRQPNFRLSPSPHKLLN